MPVRPRIVFVTRKSWPAAGGAEAVLRVLARGLAEDHEVRVLAQRIHDGPIEPYGDVTSPEPAFEPFRDGGALVEPLRVSAVGRAVVSSESVRRRGSERLRRSRDIPEGTHRWYARVVGTEIARRAQRADVLHIFCGGNLAVAAVEAGRALGVPVVATPYAHPGHWDDDPASGAAYRAASRVMATTQTDADVYRRLGVDDSRIELGAICSPALPVGGATGIREREELDGPLVVFVGLRREHKGVDLLLESAPLVARRHPDVVFAFVGPGDRLPLQAHILDVGPVEELTKAAWIEAADVLCLPSAGESFGLVVTEAWSLGTPVVTSDLPVLRELVEACGGGLVAERNPSAIATALAQVLSDPEEAKRRGESGRSYWYENYRAEAFIARHAEIYRRLTEAEATGTTYKGGSTS